MASTITLTTAQMTRIKTALRTVTDDVNLETEIADLANAAVADMGLAGITNTDLDYPLIWRALVTYCRLNFGSPDEYDQLKASYDEQKCQLGMATGYTTWTSEGVC